MKILCLSDTHGKHRRLKLPAADVLVHAGDVTVEGADHQAEDFLNWIGNLPYRHRIFIAGNHDFYFENLTERQRSKLIPPGVVYLNNSGIEINSLKIWGSPVTPWFFDWAFNRQRGKEIAREWKKIPAGTDLLITHGPPAGILDKTASGHHAGCADLLRRVNRIRPRLHVFGHIHEAYGIAKHKHTTFINASVMDAPFTLRQTPVLYELE